jgi:hypothetical protein
MQLATLTGGKSFPRIRSHGSKLCGCRLCSRLDRSSGIQPSVPWKRGSPPRRACPIPTSRHTCWRYTGQCTSGSGMRIGQRSDSRRHRCCSKAWVRARMSSKQSRCRLNLRQEGDAVPLSGYYSCASRRARRRNKRPRSRLNSGSVSEVRVSSRFRTIGSLPGCQISTVL